MIVRDQSFPEVVRLAAFVEGLQSLSHREVAPALEVRQIAIWGLLARRKRFGVVALNVCHQRCSHWTGDGQQSVAASAICLPVLCSQNHDTTWARSAFSSATAELVPRVERCFTA